MSFDDPPVDLCKSYFVFQTACTPQGCASEFCIVCFDASMQNLSLLPNSNNSCHSIKPDYAQFICTPQGRASEFCIVWFDASMQKQCLSLLLNSNNSCHTIKDFILPKLKTLHGNLANFNIRPGTLCIVTMLNKWLGCT